MPYSVTVRVRGRRAEIAHQDGMPDGDWVVAGDDRPGRVELSVLRRGPDGRFIARAEHSHSKEQ